MPNPNATDSSTVERGPAWTQDPDATPERLASIAADLPAVTDTTPDKTGWGVDGDFSTEPQQLTGWGWRAMIRRLKGAGW
jgi:hypothetical protein